MECLVQQARSRAAETYYTGAGMDARRKQPVERQNPKDISLRCNKKEGKQPSEYGSYFNKAQPQTSVK